MEPELPSIQTTIKVVPLPVGQEYEVPKGWTIKDLISTPIGENNEASEMVFHVVLLKLPPLPKEDKKSPLLPAK